MASVRYWKQRIKSNILGIPALGEMLAATSVEGACDEEGYVWRRSFWSPSVTLTTFLIQVLSAEKTLRAAVASLLTQLAAAGESVLPSGDATAYCQARQRFPEAVIGRMLRHSVTHLRARITKDNGWLGRRVWMVDGSGVSMPDTPELQEVFPQPPGQKPGCGFPVAQFVALFCWTTGAVHDVAIDTIRPHELTLFRRLWHHLEPGCVVLADRAYCAYTDMALLLQREVFSVIRLHQRRKSDFREGKRLGPGDRLIQWTRPKQWKPAMGITKQELEQLPETLSVRVVRITEIPRGFRAKPMVIATTLLDPVEVPAVEIRSLYRDRWTAELNLRSLKTSLGMDVLRGQTPDVVRKEITMHLLAYNLIRLLMWQSASEQGRDLHRLSFTGTLHRLRRAWPMLAMLSGRYDARADALLRVLLQFIGDDHVPDRPDRLEPRRRKRRPKNYTLLQKPRDFYRRHGDPDAR